MHSCREVIGELSLGSQGLRRGLSMDLKLAQAAESWPNAARNEDEHPL
jgi:hypothetical protein